MPSGFDPLAHYVFQVWYSISRHSSQTGAVAQLACVTQLGALKGRRNRRSEKQSSKHVKMDSRIVSANSKAGHEAPHTLGATSLRGQRTKLTSPKNTLWKTVSPNDGFSAPFGNCSGTPNPYNLSEKYWQYTSNLYRSTPPICNAVPCWLLNFGRETPQYTSNLYRNTPPICTAVCLPFVPAILLGKYQGLGVPERS